MSGVNPCRELVFSLVFRITLLPVNDRQIIGEPPKPQSCGRIDVTAYADAIPKRLWCSRTCIRNHPNRCPPFDGVAITAVGVAVADGHLDGVVFEHCNGDAADGAAGLRKCAFLVAACRRRIIGLHRQLFAVFELGHGGGDGHLGVVAHRSARMNAMPTYADSDKSGPPPIRRRPPSPVECFLFPTRMGRRDVRESRATATTTAGALRNAGVPARDHAMSSRGRSTMIAPHRTKVRGSASPR